TLLHSFQQWDFVGMSYLIKASILRSTGKTDLAKKYIDSLFLINKILPNSSNIMAGHEELAKIFEVEGNYKMAYFHSNRFHDMSDSISDATNKNKLAQLQVIYGKEKVETELENEKNRNILLSKENELKQTRIQSIIL